MVGIDGGQLTTVAYAEPYDARAPTLPTDWPLRNQSANTGLRPIIETSLHAGVVKSTLIEESTGTTAVTVTVSVSVNPAHVAVRLATPAEAAATTLDWSGCGVDDAMAELSTAQVTGLAVKSIAMAAPF